MIYPRELKEKIFLIVMGQLQVGSADILSAPPRRGKTALRFSTNK